MSSLISKFLMERPTFLRIPGIPESAKGSEAFGQVRDRLMVVLDETRERVNATISNILSPSYPTPDGEPLEFHWYTQKELDQINERSRLGVALSNFQQQIEEKRKNGGIPRQYKGLF